MPKHKTTTTGEPLKLIKAAGNIGLTRTSQACDRCRIKKIKCDGKIPSCTNCLGIGYNCQTSDKLTRRAFPRGYTENLEKNLITIQNENAKLITELEMLRKQFGRGGDSHDHSMLDMEDTDCSSTPSLMLDDSAVKLKRESIPSQVQPLAQYQSSFETLSDNFFRYENYMQNDNYIGLNSVNVLFNQMLSDLGLHTIQELNYPTIDSPDIHDFVIKKFLHRFPSKTNLDLLISNHFEYLNTIPILDEDLFFKSYKQVFNSIDNKTENLVNLLQPPLLAIEDANDYLVFITNLVLIIQLNCSIFNIHEIHKLITSVNLTVNMTIPKFQTLLLSLHLFHNKNCYKNTVINLTNVAHAGVLSLGIHLNYNNLQQISQDYSNTKEERFKHYAVRLKLYWSFFILSTMLQVLFGLPQVGFFERFQVPKLVTILNANQNLKNTISLIDLLTKFQDVNIMSIGEEPQKLKELDSFLVQWRKNCGLSNLFNSLSSSGVDDHRQKRIKRNTSLSQDEVVKIQLNLFYLILRMSLHLQTANCKDSFQDISSQSGYVVSSLAREYLAYIIILDRKRELNNLNNFEFHLVPINFLKFCLVSMLSIVKLSREMNHDGNAVFSDSNKLMLQTLKVIKKRYPENFVLFKEIVLFIRNEFQLTDSDLDYNDVTATQTDISTASLSTPNQTSSLFGVSNFDSYERHQSSSSDNSAGVSSIFGNNYTTQNFSGGQGAESDTSSVDELPELGSNLELLFDWSSKDHGFKPMENKASMLAYDLNYIIEK